MSETKTQSLSSFCAVVVDDEPLPRAHLAYLLREAGVGRVLQAANGAACLSLVEGEEEAPDWAFLDVQMPIMDGLALADVLAAGDIHQQGRSPAVVFVTGYEEYAVQAFERAAVDYLLKPVERERLAATLRRLESLPSQDPPVPDTTSVLMPVPKLQRLPIRLDYTVRLVDIADIVAANAHEKRVDIITPETVYSTYYTLVELEQRLPPELFFRVHESWIVSLAEVQEIHNLGSQIYQLRLRSGGRLVPVSRRRLPLLQKRLGV